VVGQQLHFDVARREDAALEIDRGITEGGAGFRARRPQRAGQLRRVRHHSHALAAAAGDGLEHQRIADPLSNREHVGLRNLVAERILGTWDNRHAGRDRDLPRGGLSPHERDRFGRGADEGHAGVAAGGREILVLGQEPVARVHCVGAGSTDRVEDPVDAQVTFAGRVPADGVGLVGHPHVKGRPIAIGVDRDAPDPHVAARADDSHRDLAAVGDQDLLH
jgi:hypothetical protein